MALKTPSFPYCAAFPIMVHPWILRKIDAILFGTYQSANSLFNISNINVAGTPVALSDKVKLLGVTLDRHLTFDSHIVQVCRSAHFHTRALRHIRNVISNDTAKSVAQALVSSHPDYTNSVLFEELKQNIMKLQRAQNTLARVVTHSSRYDSTTIQLQKLHWLPIMQRIDFIYILL